MTTTLVITVVCSLGVAVAVAIVVSGRGSRAPLEPFDPDTPVASRARDGVRRACAALAAGLVGGILGFGMGGRLMMRVLAATSPDAAGRLTDADEVVGEVTTGGSIFFVLFIGASGVVGSAAYLFARRWLPHRSLAAGAVGAAALGSVLIRPSGLLDPDNPDFEILQPTWLAVLLCTAVLALGALTVAVLVDRWTPRWPAPGLSRSGIAGLIPLGVCIVPPLAAATAVLVAQRTIRLRRSRRRARVMRVALVGGGLAGFGWIVLSGVTILT